MYCAPDDAAELWNAVLRAGQPHGLRTIGLSAIELLRIESGLLFPDIDYFPHDTDPYEVRLDNVVKPDKPGDFVGRQAIRTIAHEGTPRLLTTLRIDGDSGSGVRRRGDPGWARCRNPAQPRQSPSFDMNVIGMAAIDRDLVKDGQRVEVALGDGTAGATVAPFPLYDTARSAGDPDRS